MDIKAKHGLDLFNFNCFHNPNSLTISNFFSETRVRLIISWVHSTSGKKILTECLGAVYLVADCHNEILQMQYTTYRCSERELIHMQYQLLIYSTITIDLDLWK